MSEAGRSTSTQPAEGPTRERIDDLIAEWAQKTPDAPAVSFGSRILSYAELADAANRLGHDLTERGVGPDCRVALFMDRSIELMVAAIGVLRAGGAIVPIDPALPDERLGFMLEDSGAVMAITQSALLGRLPEGVSALCLDELPAGSGQDPTPPAPRVADADLAYVVYTSGSTGTPKGVLIEHRGVRNTVETQLRHFDAGPGRRVLQLASISFDAFVLDWTMGLCSGAQLCLASRAELLPGPPLARVLREQRISSMFITPSALAAIPDGDYPDLEMLAVGGELVTSDLIDRWAVGRRFLQLYGPTETSLWTTFEECPAGGTDPCIGQAIPGSDVLILDQDGALVPFGETGELCIGGLGLARGYLNRPDLTARSFVQRPGQSHADVLVYRSGDLASQRPDGRIDFVGRIDDQVKIRGQRIEPGEVGARLAEHPAIRDSIVVARDMGPRGLQLVAYVVTEDGDDSVIADLRRHLAEVLPRYMVPSSFVLMDVLPLTSNGKVDRKALPAPDPLRPHLDVAYRAPSGPLEESIARIWCEVLGLETVGADDGFFDLGGHSLLAAKVISRIREELGVEPSVRAFFECPTVARIATAVAERQGEDRHEAFPPITPARRDGPIPLSFSQERAWFIQQLHPQSAAYHTEMTFRFRGALDVEALEASLREIVRRHEIFRTAFPAIEGRPVQVVHESGDIPVRHVDLCDFGRAEADAELARWIRDEFVTPFDMSEPRLVRWTLVRIAPDDHMLISVEHHLVHDGWSFNVFAGELRDLYNAFSAGDSSPFPEPVVQFADYASWQREAMSGPAGVRQLEYWREQLADCPAVLELPTDRPRPPVQTLVGAARRVDLDPDLCDALRDLAKGEGASLYMVMLSGFVSLLGRYSRQSDICVGAGLANRRWREIEGLIGMVINSVALRTDLSGDPTVRELVGRVRDVCLGAYENQDVPFGQVVEVAKPKRSPSYSPLFQVMFSFHDSPMAGLDLAGLETDLELGITHGTSKFDLNIVLIPRAEQTVGARPAERDPGITLIWEYNSDLFDESTMVRMLDQLQQQFSEMVASPDRRLSELDLLADAERRQVLQTWSGETTAYPRDASLVELFDHVAAERGDAIALACRDESWRYAELAVRSSQLAHHLIEQGVEPGDRVGICLDRSPWTVASQLGVLKAGAAYVPLDPEYPKDRLGYMLEDAGLRVLISDSTEVEHLPRHDVATVLLDRDADRIASRSETTPAVRTGPLDLAYVMYTSGSTGRPKGVCVPHRAVVRLVRDTNYVDLGPEEVLLQLAPTSFDAATLEIWGALLNGAKLAIAPERRFSLQELGDLVAEHGVTTLWLTAPLFHQMVAENVEGLRGVRQLLAGGDVLKPEAIERVLATLPGCAVINGYGPTEGTTFTCCHRMTSADDVVRPVPIGRPIANTRVYILDARQELAPVGVPGELCIGGDGLATGYHGAPELTAEKFVPDPFGPDPDGRLYRSGDLARWRSDGTIEFMGRIDAQVKVRGFRVEPGEIESELAAHPQIEETVVVAREDAPGDKRLVAYVVAVSGDRLTPQTLRSHLRERLPDYMVPAAYVMLDALPLTPSGKLDRGALPAPIDSAGDAVEDFVEARTEVEKQLVAIWGEVLDRTRIGVHDDFFALGGHSLLATQVASRVLSELGVELSLRTLLQAPTVAELGAEVEAARSTSDRQEAPAITAVPRRGRAPRRRTE